MVDAEPVKVESQQMDSSQEPKKGIEEINQNAALLQLIDGALTALEELRKGISKGESKPPSPVNYWSAIWQSFIPLLFPILLLAVLFHYEGSGYPYLDASLWPSTGQFTCTYSSLDCEAFAKLALQIKILMLACAALPLANNYSYLKEILKAAEQERESASTAVWARKWAQRFAYVALLVNAVWFALIYALESPPSSHRDVWAIFVLFAVFAVVDLLLARSYKAGFAGTEAAHQHDFFFGNMCFIDIPILLGALLVIRLSSNVSGGEGELAASTLRAVGAGAAVMHLAASQFVYCFLTLQLKLKRAGA